ncbi:MAG: radical SAM protein [Clostridia bacterium]|nr:radical SAM protein [Clostridia bacterium]
MTEITVSNIQRFSTGDGPGIRTTVFFKGCNLRCPWCHNPENISPVPQTLYYPSAKRSVSYGVRMTPQEIAENVSEDKDFYAAGGGGVTLSGGEPMLQYRGASELSEILSASGINVLVDTAGCVPWEAFESVLEHVCDFYFDIKTADAGKYREIGGDLELISGNLRRLVGRGANVRVRIPFIPGFNTSDDDCASIRDLIVSTGAGRADLLPFHRLGTSKYEALGKEYRYKDTKPPQKQELQRAAEIYGKYLDVGIE